MTPVDRSASPPPEAFVLPPGITAAEGALDLVSIPAALVLPAVDGVKVEFGNAAFDSLGIDAAFGHASMTPNLAARITTFLASGELRHTVACRIGDVVEERRYRVTLARVLHHPDPRCVISFVDETEEVRNRQNLRREMSTDSLTGLPNRAGFSDRLEAMIAEERSRVAVLMVDLDRFSRVNACLGSLAGDELLITVARRIRGALRGHDILARIGGDEFGILMAIESGQSEADHVASRIKGALSAPFRLSDYEIRVSCAVGIAFGTDAVEDVEDVIRHAQFAMKRAKTSGRAEAYQTQAFDLAREEFAMETALRRAIDANQLRLSYQPICDLATGRIVAFESLARWTDEAGVEISPDDFIPVAEESGLILPLGRWAIDEALRTLADWDRRSGGDCGVAMAVNLSAIQLQRDSIAPVVEQALAAHRLEGRRLKLELTESALISDPDRIARALHALKALGTTLAMDDFGTGYSNLAYLQKLPIDILKIDRSFVTGMLDDRDKIAIIRAILSLAQALGMATVAEGIETPELGQTLAALGCTYGQGYVYARPLDADAAYALLSERNA